MEKHSFSESLIVQSNIFLIDWLTVSFKTETVGSVIAMLGLDSSLFVEKVGFKNGYPLDTFFSNIHIWSGADDPKYYTAGFNKAGKWITAEMKARDDMGVCLNLSGQGCRSFEEHSKVGWFDLLKLFFQRNGNITRLDLAYDDHMGVVDIHRLIYDVKSRNYRSKAKWVDLMWSDDQENDIEGNSIYIGKRSSDVLIRIYDKAAERGYKDRHWIRIELQLRDDRAYAAVQRLFQKDSIGVVAGGILRNYFTVCVPSNDTNKSRWPVAYYWERVLGQMETIRLWSAPGEPYNFHKAESHMVAQYCQFLLTFKEIHGSIHDLLTLAQRHHGDKPLKPKYVNAINEHFSFLKQRSGAPVPSMSDGCNSAAAHFSNDMFNFLYDDPEDPDCPW